MKIILILAVTVFNLLPNIALADEFGKRFSNQTPKGLAAYDAEEDQIPDIAMDEVAKKLQDVAPAAGDEEKESVIEDPEPENEAQK